VKVFTYEANCELADRSPDPDVQWEDNTGMDQGRSDLSQELKALTRTIVNRKIIFIVDREKAAWPEVMG
jgi:hypothetical protein